MAITSVFHSTHVFNTYHCSLPSIIHVTHIGDNDICHKIHGTASTNTTMAITSAINIKLIYNQCGVHLPLCLEIFLRHINTITPRCWNLQRIAFSSDLRKTCLFNWWELFLMWKNILFWRKLNIVQFEKSFCVSRPDWS